jgi:WD repeat-containing protein 35
MSLAVDSAIIFVNIQPNYLWSYFNNTLVFAFQKPEKNDMTIVYWDSVVNEKHVRTMKGLLHIKAAGEYCVLVSEIEESKDEYILILSNAVGCPVDSKTINIKPRYVAMNTTHVIVCSDETVYYWQYRSQYSQSVSLESEKKKRAGKESAFHIDENPNPNTIYDRTKWKISEEDIQDPILSVASGKDGFIVGRSSGQVYQYTLPYIQRNDNNFYLKCKPQTLSLNSDCTKFSIIDINGVLTFFDMEECPPGTKVPGYHKPEEKKEVWSVIWSTDNPDMCALMEKNRMFVMRDFKQEEPVLSSGYLCHFSDLEVKAVLLDDILKAPEDIKNISDFLESYDCRSLRDTRDHLTTISLKDAVDFVDQNPHPRLWRLIAEAALEKLDFQVAEKAFVKIEDYHGIKFLKRLKNIDDKYKQKAEISAYFNKFDEAEQIYREIDRKDLALDLRMKLGDWSKVVALIEQGVGDDDILKEAYNKMGDFCVDKQRWSKASYYFQQSNNYESLIDVYYRLEQFANLDKLIDDIPSTSGALSLLAEKMQSIGI